MSSITSIVLQVGILNDDIVVAVNSWLRDTANAAELSKVNEAAAGNKALEIGLWAGAYNYFFDREFLAFAADLAKRFDARDFLIVTPDDGSSVLFCASDCNSRFGARYMRVIATAPHEQ